jgi:hypothetical protein
MLIRFHLAIDGGGNMSSIPNDQAAAKAYDGFGIASFALAAIAMLSFGMLLVYATAFNTSGDANATIGECMVLIWMINYLGIGLGVASLACRRVSKSFPALGISMHFGLLLLSGALVAIGLHMR